MSYELLYEEVLKTTFTPCLLVLDNLCEISGCSVMTDFISTMFDFFKCFLVDK